MTGELNIDYEGLAQEAMRGMVRSILARTAKTGRLPGKHHFYISFATEAPGVVLSRRLKQQYPREMTVVLQHIFAELTVTDDHFSVKLTFDGIPERLVVPFTAIRVFFDPSVPYGLQFDGSDLAADTEGDETSDLAEPSDVRPLFGPARPHAGNTQPEPTAPGGIEKKARSARKPRGAKRDGTDAPSKPTALPSKRSGDDAAQGPALGRQAGRPHLVASKPEAHDPPANDTKVISLDKFRKK